jgi:hypothetical protein
MAMVEVQEQRADTRPKGRSRRHAHGRFGAKSPPASAAAAEQLHPRHNGVEGRQINMIVAPTASLNEARNVGAAMTAGFRHAPFGLVRRRRQRAGFAFARRTFAARALSVLPAPTKAILRGRDRRVPGRLARLAHQGFQLADPRNKALDHLPLLGQQGVFVGVAQIVAWALSHP